jgi:hypothetical protein
MTIASLMRITHAHAHTRTHARKHTHTHTHTHTHKQIEPGMMSVKAIERGSVLVDLAIHVTPAAIEGRGPVSGGDRARGAGGGGGGIHLWEARASGRGERGRSSEDLARELQSLASDPFGLLSGCVCVCVCVCVKFVRVSEFVCIYIRMYVRV